MRLIFAYILKWPRLAGFGVNGVNQNLFLGSSGSRVSFNLTVLLQTIYFWKEKKNFEHFSAKIESKKYRPCTF